jgi:hypothetical protein
MDLSMEIARTCRQVDGLLDEKAATLSPLLKVQQFQLHQEWVEKLQDLRRKLDAISDQLQAESKKIDEAWTSGIQNTPEGKELFSRLDGLRRLFSFLGRWQGQLQERIVQLSF